MWYGCKPDLSHLKVFGCRCLVHVPSCHRTKLDMKATEHIFVGYSDDPRSYYFRNVETPRSLIKSRDVTFFENNFTGLKEMPENNLNLSFNPNVINLLSQISSSDANPSLLPEEQNDFVDAVDDIDDNVI